MRTRTLSLHTRVSAEEYRRVQALAPGEPLTSEWLRHYLLAQVTIEERLARVEAEAVRTRIVVEQMAALAVQGRLTAETVTELLDDAQVLAESMNGGRQGEDTQTTHVNVR